MDKIQLYNDTLNKLSQLNSEFNLLELFLNLTNELDKYKKENNILKDGLFIKETKYNELFKKYNDEINTMNKEIEKKDYELNNFNKVSVVVSLHKELDEKKKYIQILEGQVDKLRNSDKKKVSSNNTVDKPKELLENEIVKESTDNKLLENEQPDDIITKKSKKKKVIDIEFNIDDFVEINGYELLTYKKKFYLRDLETSEIYSIKNYKPDIIVGLLTPNGKIKFN